MSSRKASNARLSESNHYYTSTGLTEEELQIISNRHNTTPPPDELFEDPENHGAQTVYKALTKLDYISEQHAQLYLAQFAGWNKLRKDIKKVLVKHMCLIIKPELCAEPDAMTFTLDRLFCMISRMNIPRNPDEITNQSSEQYLDRKLDYDNIIYGMANNCKHIINESYSNFMRYKQMTEHDSDIQEIKGSQRAKFLSHPDLPTDLLEKSEK